MLSACHTYSDKKSLVQNHHPIEMVLSSNKNTGEKATKKYGETIANRDYI
jgi:hypothetical protein